MQRRIIIVLVLHLLVCSAGRCGGSSEAGLGQSGTLNPAGAHGGHLLEVRWTLNEGLPWEEQRWPHKEKKTIIRMRERNAASASRWLLLMSRWFSLSDAEHKGPHKALCKHLRASQSFLTTHSQLDNLHGTNYAPEVEDSNWSITAELLGNNISSCVCKRA